MEFSEIVIQENDVIITVTEGENSLVISLGKENNTQAVAEEAAAAIFISYIASFTPSYKQLRREAYPAISDQLDLIYWDKINGTNNWSAAVKAVKDEYPKE